ncbi:MAG: SH3 domain-containing protein [Pseudomonadota bacterium]
MKRRSITTVAAPLAFVVAIASAATPLYAKPNPNAEIPLAKCEVNLGTIAVLEGDTQGWTKYGLASPRELIGKLASESKCFTLQGGTSGKPADFLMYAIAGDKEEVDKSVELAKTAVIEGAVRSGAASAVLGRVPMVGGMLGMFGGMGGKKKTYAAGLRVVSPATGQTVISGTGEAKSSSITFAGLGDTSGLGGYGSTKDGKMLSTAFIQAFNGVVAQGSALVSAKAAAPAPAAAAATASYVTAVDTKMWAEPGKPEVLRSLRAATALSPTGKRQGLFIEVKDNFGTTGWVSVEDMK